MKTIINFPQNVPQKIPAHLTATVGFAVHIDEVGHTGILVIDGSKMEITYNQGELAPGYIPKEGDKVIFEAANLRNLDFPYMQVRNIRKRVGY